MRASPSLRAVTAGVLAGFLTLSSSVAALAQYAYEPDVLMPPRAVIWQLNDRGFTDITRPRFDGRAYMVEASNLDGDRVRLFVDARSGRIVGRQRLDAPPARLVRRGAPGYGWTEEDEAPRRPMREAERIVPPADIPFPQSLPRRSRPGPAESPDLGIRPDVAARSAPPVTTQPEDRNPMGLNPDARGPETRPRTDAPRKAARLAPAAKPATPSAASDSPKLSDVPPAPARGEASPNATTAVVAPPPARTPADKIPSGTSMTPASVQPPPAEKPAAQTWKDVPADAKRPVRVIGGATLVPGTTTKAAD